MVQNLFRSALCLTAIYCCLRCISHCRICRWRCRPIGGLSRSQSASGHKLSQQDYITRYALLLIIDDLKSRESLSLPSLSSSTTMSPSAHNVTHEIWDSAFWGPVTATLDWCEVRLSALCFRLHVISKPSESTALTIGIGKLPVQQVHRRGCEYLLESGHHGLRAVRDTARAQSATSCEVPRRLDGMSRKHPRRCPLLTGLSPSIPNNFVMLGIRARRPGKLHLPCYALV